MKKTTMALCPAILAMVALTIGCGGKYSDVKKVNGEFIGLVEDYSADLEKVGDAKSAAKAINRFADGMEELWPKMQQLHEKHPELKDTAHPPEALVESQKEAEEAGRRMAGSMMKLMAYMQDPEVQQAQQRLGAIMMQQ